MYTVVACVDHRRCFAGIIVRSLAVAFPGIFPFRIVPKRTFASDVKILSMPWVQGAIYC